MMMNQPWFSPKRNGIGVRPSNAKGWILMLAFIVILVFGVILLNSSGNTLLAWVLIVLDAMIFAAIVKAKTHNSE